MLRANTFAMASVACALGACAIHPLPEDYTGVSTYHIVRQIRCETRQAVIDSAIGWLTNDDDVSPEARAIGHQFENKLRPIESLSPTLFNGRERDLFKLFWNTGIAYNYDLEMEEKNDFSTTVNLLKPFTDGKGTLGASAGIDKRRRNTRTFTVTDTFATLVRDIRPDYCDGFIVAENRVYPVTGKIGIEPMVQEFIRMALFGALAGTKANPKGPPTMVDALHFETRLSGSVTPKVEFNPVGRALTLASASLTGSASRRDLHQIVVGLAIDAGSLTQVAAVRSEYYFGPLLTARGSGSAQAAAIAVNQYLTNSLFRRVVIINE